MNNYYKFNRQIAKKINKLEKYLNIEATYNEFIEIKYLQTLINFFLILIKRYKNMNIICIPNIGISSSNNKNYRSTFIINLQSTMKIDYIMDIPNNMQNELDKCNKNKKQFVIVVLAIIIKEIMLEHANIIIIDLYNNTIERFEPYGQSLPMIPNRIFYEKIIYNNIIIFKDKYLGKNFKYIRPAEISPLYGIQSKVEFTEEGKKYTKLRDLCLIWSIMYLHLRVLNPNLKPDKIVKILLNYSFDKLQELAYKYIKFIKDILQNK